MEQTGEFIDLRVKNGVYRHFKGGHYLVIGVALHSETREEMIIYVRLYSRKGNPFFVRPIKNFLEKVECDGVLQNRFEFVGLDCP